MLQASANSQQKSQHKIQTQTKTGIDFNTYTCDVFAYANGHPKYMRTKIRAKIKRKRMETRWRKSGHKVSETNAKEIEQKRVKQKDVPLKCAGTNILYVPYFFIIL